MKVRKKGESRAKVWEVHEESPSFYIVFDQNGLHEVLRKDRFEEVKEDLYADVTAECRVKACPFSPAAQLDGYPDHEYILHDKNANTITIPIAMQINDVEKSAYRIRKVQVICGDWRVSEPTYSDAFIVERKVSD